jgi:NAD(P)-dependent dehydrogenase (short-subunit alcohol dehydrogenase family)
MTNLSGKTALVTGASRGIGRAMACSSAFTMAAMRKQQKSGAGGD